ncbi:MAG: hypothetical protein WA123_08870 [Methylotenera sp.]
MQHNHASTQQLDPGFDFLSKSGLRTYHGDRHIRINISRNTLIAIIFSLFLHALIFFFVPQIQFDNPASVPARAIEVSLAPPRMATQVIKPVQEARQVVEKPVVPVKKPITKVEPKKIIAQKLIKTTKPSFVVPDTPAAKPALDTRPPKERVVKETPVQEQYTDMASYVKARQAQRLESEAVAANVNAEAAARERGPTEAQLREDRIKRNLNYGTNGIFEITSLGARNATFAFRGWTNDYSTSKRQFFEVEANNGEDVRLLMIRRMIALIREHYQGNFNWESHRLGRSVVQSARLEDNAGLEDFLMMEFFGSNYKTSQ